MVAASVAMQYLPFYLHKLLRYIYFENVFKGNEFRKKETICCKCESHL